MTPKTQMAIFCQQPLEGDQDESDTWLKYVEQTFVEEREMMRKKNSICLCQLILLRGKKKDNLVVVT